MITNAGNNGVIPRLAMALLVFIAFCALAATGAELIAAGRAAFGGDDAARATRSR